MYLIRFSKQADKDKKLLKGAGLDRKAKDLLNIIAINPFQNPPFRFKNSNFCFKNLIFAGKSHFPALSGALSALMY